MKRRTQTAITPQKLFEQMTYTKLHWPGKTVSLERNSLSDHQQRTTSGRMSIAEFYHDNSKLFPQMLGELTASQVAVEEFRRQYVDRRSAAARSSGCTNLETDSRWRELLQKAVATVGLDIFYAIELRMSIGESQGVYDPGSNLLQLVKWFSSTETAAVRQALRLLGSPDEEPFAGSVLFILGSFARDEILFGPRAYRHTLFAAGRVTQAVLSCAKQMQIPARARYDFADREVDAAMEADGIELGTLVAIELGETSHVS